MKSCNTCELESNKCKECPVSADTTRIQATKAEMEIYIKTGFFGVEIARG